MLLTLFYVYEVAAHLIVRRAHHFVSVHILCSSLYLMCTEVAAHLIVCVRLSVVHDLISLAGLLGLCF